MRIFPVLSTLFVSILLLTGCVGGLPVWRQSKSEKSLEKAKYQLDENIEVTKQKAVGFMYGADWSLALDPTPSRYSIIAKTMTERSLLSAGNPNTKIALDFQNIVQGLISTNLHIRQQAKIQLRKKDLEVIKLQSNIEKLEAKVEKAEDKAKEVAEHNSVLASKYSRLMFWAKMIIGVVIFGFVIRIAAAVLPPPYNGIGGVIDLIFGSIFKLLARAMPKVKEYAGVVSKETHDISEKTLASLVSAIQQARNDPKIKQKIDPILRDKTDNEVIRPKITRIKEELGHI